MRRFLAVLLLAGLAWAQDPLLQDPEAALAATKERLASVTDPNWKTAVERRIQFLEEHLRTIRDKAEIAAPLDVEARRAAAEAALAAERAKEAPAQVQLPSPDELAAYETALREAQAQRDEKQRALDALRKRQKEAEEEQKKLPAREGDARRRLEEFAKEDEYSQYRAANARFELALLGERQAFLKEALPRWTALAPVLQLELDALKLRAERAQKAYDLAAAEAARLRAAEAERAQAEAERKKRAAERERDPVERLRKTLAAEATQTRAETTTLQNALEDVKKTVLRVTDAKTAFIKERERLENRLRLKGSGNADLLRRSLQRTTRSRQLLDETTLPRLQADIARYQAALVGALDRQWELQQPEEENPVLQGLLETLPAPRHEEARRVFTEATEGKDGLVPALREKVAVLEAIDARHGELAGHYADYGAELELLREFVLERIYWIRNAPPLSLDVGTELTRTGRILASGAEWDEIGLPRGSLLGGGAAVLVLGLFLALRLRRRRARQVVEGQANGTLGRAAVGLVLAVAPAAAFYLFANLVSALALPPAVDPPLTRLLLLFALFLLVEWVATWLLGRDGVAVRLLNQPVALATELLRSIRLVALGGAFFYTPARVLAAEPFELERVPRLLETAWFATWALALVVVIGRRSALIRHLTSEKGFVRRAWLIAGPLLSLGLVAIVVMDVLGYRVGASFLMVNAIRTTAALLLLMGLYAVLNRLIRKISSRVLARAMKEEGAAAAWQSSVAVTNELTRLAALLLTTVALFTLLHFWGIGGMFVRALDSVRLTDLGPEQWLTLWSVAKALLWIVAGHFVVHNLAAVYEHLVFPLIGKTDKGGRFVFLALSRYAIFVVAYSAAFLALGFSFASVGWLLAAASVGIGFGLQEIIANFVSGLILLLERPIRVGDIISVGDTGGTVEKINIRATTVINWDRQTLLIPNKNFITQNLTNWTHNDQFMRRKLRVGVAYGTDVEKVLKILDEVVKAHPKVLRDPAHRIWFDGFGDSSLDFEIWFFARIDEGKPTMTELNTKICQRFAQEGVEIPFPQRDLHIRSVPEAEGIAGLVERRADATP